MENIFNTLGDILKPENNKCNTPDRKQLNDKRRDCRYVLEMFMEHWSLALLKL